MRRSSGSRSWRRRSRGSITRWTTRSVKGTVGVISSE